MRLECYTAAGQTLVPNVFIDKYMAEANGEFVKVYLCLLRTQGAAEISVESLAERLDLSERTVNRALKYLEKCGLLKLFYDAEGHMNGIRMLSGTDIFDEPVPLSSASAVPGRASADAAEAAGNAAAPAAASAAAPAKPARAPRSTKETEAAAPEKAAPAAAERRHYQPTEVSRLCEEDGEFNMLVSVVAPAYLNRTLSHQDVEVFAWLHRDLQLPVDVLEYCVEQCVERKKEDYSKTKFIRYIETVARSWHEEGVRDLAGARAAVSRFDEKVRARKDVAAGAQDASQAPAETSPSRRKKPGTGRSAKVQAAYGFSTERGSDEVDYNALAWSRMWEEK
ncbi:MAG: DnaD domain protein [Lachnospiraceae bacterium]|nr:DnaD domain protein [Lachnospiraceae bacterium]